MATTSGTSTFNIDLLTIVEEAFERCGLEVRSGYDLETARRSLSLLALELQNMGVNLFTITEGTQALSEGTASYFLGSGVIDLIEYVVRKGSGVSQVDYPLTRISVSTYAKRTTKNTRSRPTDIYVDRQTDGVTVRLWPVPDSDDYTLTYWYMRRIEDLGANTNHFDAPERFIPAVTAGLAYHLAVKRAPNRVELLKAMFNESLRYAFEEDRERAPLRIVPNIGRVL